MPRGATPEAVIKAARRHHRRRWLAAEVAMAVVAAGVAAVIAGSGGGGGRAGSTGPVTWLSPVPVPRGLTDRLVLHQSHATAGTPIQGTLVTYRGDAPLNLTRLNPSGGGRGPRLFCRPQFLHCAYQPPDYHGLRVC